jgi:mannose/fructose/N-acetylgalactosamine-specific phosphotransferase system component IIB
LPILLYRIDERLIHGQVVIGWGNQLRPDRYLVVDDELVDSEWEQDLYRLGSGGAEVVFVTPDEARERLGEWRAASERSIVLTRNIATMRRLADGGLLEGEAVNIGGVHHGPGRREILEYVHLTEGEMKDLEAMADAGVEILARDLPDAHRVSLGALQKSRWKSPK